MKIRHIPSLVLVTGVILLASHCVPARASSQLAETLQRIFNRHEFDEQQFGSARWIEDGAAYTTLEPAADSSTPAREIVRYETESGKRTVLVAAAQLVPPHRQTPLIVEDYAWSSGNRRVLIYTNSQKVWRQNTRGDYWVLDLASGRLHELGGDAPPASLMFAQFSPDGQSVAYVRANNIYVEYLKSGLIRPLTRNGSSTLMNGTSDWANEEELNIRCGFSWSPDGRFIAYYQFDTSGVGVFTLINDIDSEYPTLKQFPYPHPGTTNSAVRIGVVSVKEGPTHWLKLDGDPRNYYIAAMTWVPHSNQIAVERLNRLQNKEQILIADAGTGVARQIYADTDPAWIDSQSSFPWIDGGRAFVWMSEDDGWRHAYKIAMQGGKPKLLTTVPGDVIEGLGADESSTWFYYLASPANATQRYLYRVRLNGTGGEQRVTPQGEAGTHNYDLSPDGKWAFHRFSSFDRPPVTELVRLPDHKSIRVLERNWRLEHNASELIASPVEFFQVMIGGGVKLDGWMMKPPGFDPAQKYPVLVYAYGEPAQTTVNDAWGGQREMFHRAIADDGFIVVNFDNQGTPAPKGRAWRKVIYRQIGILASAQQAEAIRQLAAERPYLDMSRMAVWGWSGGGSMTLNLMFRYPDLFAAGMAVAPIADQHYYDTIYQERYMGLPVDNEQGYRDGSPINFAGGLRGKLLIVHGSGDDNCHYQVTELLLNRLIALGKPFDFMDYPNRTHAIVEGPGTSFHLYSLLARYLEEHVAAGGRAR